jgi:hypothetical protein
MITRENYESWLIDLIDGNLTDKHVNMVLDFLQSNPDINEEFKNLEKVLLVPDQNTHFQYNKLLKTDFDHPEIFEETAIRSIEKQLSVNDEEKFEQYLNSSEKAKQNYKQYLKTILIPDTSIIYPYKNKLLKNRALPLYWLAAAAVVVFAVLFWFNTDKQQTIPTQQTAQILPALEPEKSTLVVKHFKTELSHFIANNTANTNTNQGTEILPSNPVENEYTTVALLKTIDNNSVSANFDDVQLAHIPIKFLNTEEPDNTYEIFPTVKEYLASKFDRKIDEIDPQHELSRFKYMALNRINSASNYKFDYAVNNNGELSHIAYNSRLVSVSIPLNNSK